MNVPLLLLLLGTTATPVRSEETTASPNNVSVTIPGSLVKYWDCECGVPMYAKTDPEERIVKGQPTRTEEFPWFAALMNGNWFHNQAPKCGGTLITDRHVITAAHCLLHHSGLSPSNTYVMVGGYNWKYPKDKWKDISHGTHKTQMRRVYDGVAWSTFDPSDLTHNGDVAVLQLMQPVEFNAYTYPMCLPPLDYTVEKANQGNVLVIGYGYLDHSRPDELLTDAYTVQPDELFRTTRKMRLVNYKECSRDREVMVLTRRKSLSHRHICAYGDDTDSCSGDSGGPLMTYDKEKERYYLIGIVSFGPKFCNRPGVPGVYTNVLDESVHNFITCNLADGFTCRH